MPQALSNLAVGSKVKFGKYQVNTETAQPIIWTIVAKNHQCTPAYPENAITLHATEILDLRCFDAIEVGNTTALRQNYGNNRYSVSNIDQWLNSDASGDAWYSAAHSKDHSPDTSSGTGSYGTQYANRPGFLNGFSVDEKSAILSTTIRSAKGEADGGSYEDIIRKVFLPTINEIGLSDAEITTEGASWNYYTSMEDRVVCVTQQCFSNTPSRQKPSSKGESWDWWTRTPVYGGGVSAYKIYTNGNLNTSLAYAGSVGVRPALNLSSSLLVSDSTDSDGCYTFVWTSPTDYTFTLNGTQYTNVAKINYVSGNTTKQIKKLVVNGSTVWQA